MQYQKLTNLLDNATTQLSRFRTKIWVEINNQLQGTYSKTLSSRLKC